MPSASDFTTKGLGLHPPGTPPPHLVTEGDGLEKQKRSPGACGGDLGVLDYKRDPELQLPVSGRERGRWGARISGNLLPPWRPPPTPPRKDPHPPLESAYGPIHPPKSAFPFGDGFGTVWGRSGDGLGTVWGWSGDGLGMVRRWFGDGSGTVWGWFGTVGRTNVNKQKRMLPITLTGVVAQTPYFARTSGRFVGRFWFNLGPNGLV